MNLQNCDSNFDEMFSVIGSRQVFKYFAVTIKNYLSSRQVKGDPCHKGSIHKGEQSFKLVPSLNALLLNPTKKQELYFEY